MQITITCDGITSDPKIINASKDIISKQWFLGLESFIINIHAKKLDIILGLVIISGEVETGGSMASQPSQIAELQVDGA